MKYAKIPYKMLIDLCGDAGWRIDEYTDHKEVRIYHRFHGGDYKLHDGYEKLED